MFVAVFLVGGLRSEEVSAFACFFVFLDDLPINKYHFLPL
jgi:hypothetical protein